MRLYGAVSRKAVSFNQLDARTGARVKQKLVSAADGEEVLRDQIVKGYPLGPGSYVTVTDDELASIMPSAQRTMELEEFVDLHDIDPVHYDSAYYLVPDAAAIKPYALLVDAMERAGKVGIARFVMRSKEYLAVLRVREGKLVLHTMVYTDELTAVEELPTLEAAAQVELTEREQAMAAMLVESLTAAFEPTKYHDAYRDQLLDIIERKASGETQIVVATGRVADTRVVDLLAALEASVAEAKAARRRHPTSSTTERGEMSDAQDADVSKSVDVNTRRTA